MIVFRTMMAQSCMKKYMKNQRHSFLMRTKRKMSNLGDSLEINQLWPRNSSAFIISGSKTEEHKPTFHSLITRILQSLEPKSYKRMKVRLTLISLALEILLILLRFRNHQHWEKVWRPTWTKIKLSVLMMPSKINHRLQLWCSWTRQSNMLKL